MAKSKKPDEAETPTMTDVPAAPLGDMSNPQGAEGEGPVFRVLAQYIRDLSFENPRAPDSLRADAPLSVVTRSEQGCVIVTRERTQAVPAYPVDRVVDTTGAGDLFAAGFLFGLARGYELETAARLGALAASEVIQHIGARPEVSLKQLAAENGLGE